MLSPFERRTVTIGGPAIPAMPPINPPSAPLITKIYFVIVVFNLQPVAIKITKKITKIDIMILTISALIEIKKKIPIGNAIIIEKNIGIISLNLHFRAPSKVK